MAPSSWDVDAYLRNSQCPLCGRRLQPPRHTLWLTCDAHEFCVWVTEDHLYHNVDKVTKTPYHGTTLLTFVTCYRVTHRYRGVLPSP